MSLGLGNGSTVTYGTSLEEVSIRELQPHVLKSSNKISAWTKQSMERVGKSIDDTMDFPLPWVLLFFWGSREDAICAMAKLGQHWTPKTYLKKLGLARANMVSHTR